MNAKDITYVNTAPSVIGLANGGFAITWQGQSDHPESLDRYGQFQHPVPDLRRQRSQGRHPASGQYQGRGVPAGPEAHAADQRLYRRDLGGRGRRHRDHGQIKARVIDANGNPVGDEFTVNSNADGEQHTPAIAARPDGSFIITWTDNNVATDDDDGIRGRIFSVSNGDAPTHLNLSASLTDKDGSEKLAVWCRPSLSARS